MVFVLGLGLGTDLVGRWGEDAGGEGSEEVGSLESCSLRGRA